jgi:Uma2 family endonuclease
MHMRLRPYEFTFDEFCDLVKDGQKADLIDGVIYMASPDSLASNDLFMFLGGLMRLYAGQFDLGKVFGTRVAYKLDERNSPEPDIGFVRADRLGKLRGGHFKGPPDLAVELVSPDSIERDYVTKRAKYESAGIKEYWIVDPIECRVTFLRLDRSGHYREVRSRNGIYRSRVLKGFWFRAKWFWQDPLPKELSILQQILAKPK